jgi:hypothetical protein
MGSDAYKRELAKRLEQGATPEQAHSIAAEEGLIDAFARAGSQSDASDIRAWFKAFKASVKHLAGSKLSPEDAIAWMHYATHNDTPWSGLKGRAGLGERNQGPVSADDKLNKLRSEASNRMIKVLVNQQGDMGKMEIRELIQNSIDAVYKRKEMDPVNTTPLGVAYRIHNNNTALMADTGTGMSPDFLARGYLQLGISTKDIGDGGGLGLAKAGLFGRAEKFEVRSVWTDKETYDRYVSRLYGNSDGFYDKQIKDIPPISLSEISDTPKTFKLANGLSMDVTKLSPFSASTKYDYTGPDGTYVALKYPENIQLDDSAGYKTLDFNSNIHQGSITKIYDEDLKNPFMSHEPDSLISEIGKGPSFDYAQPSSSSPSFAYGSRKFSNGEVSITAKEGDPTYPSNHIRYDVYSNGVHQFTGYERVQDAAAYPNLDVNIKASVSGDSPDYPFTIDRNTIKSADMKQYVLDTLNEMASRKAKERTDMFAKALVDAPKITTASGKELIVLDVSKKLPTEVITGEMSRDRELGKVIDTSSIIHDTVKQALMEAYPNLSYDKADFVGILTGTANAYGVRFGTEVPNSPGQIYYDPFLMLSKVIHDRKASNLPLNPTDIFVDYLALHLGVSVHEISHQVVHSEGEDLARELTFKLGQVISKSDKVAALLREVVQDKKDYNADSLIKSIERYDEYIKTARSDESGDNFLSGLQTSDTNRKSRSGTAEGLKAAQAFDPNVRDQGPSLGPLDSEQRKLSRVNPVVGEAFTSAFNTRDRTMGELSSKLAKVAALSETNKRELLKHLENESDSNTLVQPPAHLAEAYAQMRNEFIPEVPQMFNNAGFGIRTAKGFRAHGQNPTYMMLHHISPDVRETLTTKQGSPEYAGLKKDFIDWTRDYLIRAGMNPADATTQAVTKFEKEITEYNRKPDAAETLGFAGVRKPEGATLPPSWRSDDLMGNLSNYIKRSATDFASQTHIESSPEVMAALGAKKFGADKEIDPVILQATPNIVSHPVLQNVLRDYHGRMADNSTLADVGRVVSPLALGPISRSVDVMTTGLKGLAYLRPSEYVDGAINFAKGLTEWSALMSRSHQSGLNRLDTGANMRHVMGVGDANVNFMTRFASGLNKFTGLDKLESGARAIAQNWGETIVAMKRQQALAGDAKSVEFLDTLSKDWRSRDDLDLAAQVGRLLQGSYDTRQLPGWMLDGGLAPFLTWSKWSAGQLQAFNDFAVAPLFKGDVKPLVGQLLIGVLGGSVVQQVQEWMNNRQTRDVNWKELEAWADQNKGALGAPGSTLLASKLLTLSQRMGTFGFAGDLVKGVVEAAAGQNPQGVLHNPAIEGIFNTSKYGAAAIAAISSGEDVGAVLSKLTKDLAVNNSQVVRAARNWVDTDENLAYNDRRRQNLFNFLRGEGAGANTFAVSYKDLAEKEFDKTKEPADMVAQAGKLLEKAATDATSQEDFVARLRKLGTSQNSIMPNPRRQPDKAFKYLKWVHDAEGADESSSTQRRWQEEDARAKYRKALVSPGSAGAR